MNLAICESLSGRLRGSVLYDGLHNLGAALRTSVARPGTLHIVGPDEATPWHLSAHLDMLARYRNVPELAPTAPHTPLSQATDGDVVLVVSERQTDDLLLGQLDDARRRGGVIVGLTGAEDAHLGALAVEMLTVADDAGRLIPGIHLDFEMTTHLFGVAAVTTRRRRWWSR